MDWDVSTLFFVLDDLLVVAGAVLILFLDQGELGAYLLAAGLILFFVTGGGASND